MVRVCVVPGCSNRSNRECHLSYHSLPLKNKKLLKIWIHKIGRKNTPINKNSYVCSVHFVDSAGRRLRPDEYPTANLPMLTNSLHIRPRKSPTKRIKAVSNDSDSDSDDTIVEKKSVAVQTSESFVKLKEENLKLQMENAQLLQQLKLSQFRLDNILKNDQKIQYYTGFPNYGTLKSFYDFLGPAVNNLNYWGSSAGVAEKSPTGRNRVLPPMEEFFLVLVRLRLGTFEKDLADRFNISVSTVSRICLTWINFLYLKVKEIPLWPKREVVQFFMPSVFKSLYPSTRVIIDATEIFVETSSLPEFQQMTYSSYKSHNTYKTLIGISPGGAVTFVSKLFPGSISDKELTRKSGLLELLERGDSVMADRGFDIQDYLTPIGVKVNIPPFLNGKPQFDPQELVETRRIASLRIHVERAMGRIKNYHIFSRTVPSSLTNVSDLSYVLFLLTFYHHCAHSIL